MTPGTISDRPWILRGRNLALGYGRAMLFHDLSFEIAQGEIVGIVGPNGSGKTTLLRTLLGLLPALAGSVELRAGASFSYMPQRERFDRILPVTALDVVLMGPAARASALHRVRAAERDAARGALALVGIESLGPKLFRSLSAGQQQRVRLARALATSPDVLVLDEPTAGMDVSSEAATVDFLRQLNQLNNVTVLIVTHLLPIVLNLATSMMLMGKGTILQGRVDEVLQEDKLTTLYGVPVHIGTVAGQRTLVVHRHGLDV